MGSARSLLPPWRRGGREAEIGWLSLTPEPERELPPVVAALRSERPARASARRSNGSARPSRRSSCEGGSATGSRYLSEAVRLLLDSPEVGLSAAQREAALEVLANHHRLLLGLPGDAAERTEAERVALERAIDAFHADHQANNRNGGP